jgi:hypothetical protein
MHGNAEGVLGEPFLLRCDYRNPNALTVADLNYDGKSDILVTVDPVISIYFGNGAGQFPTTGGAYNGSNAITLPTLGDFNNDGILDLTGVFTSFRDVITIMIGESSGSFSRFANYQSTNNVLAQANSLTVGDINKDGYVEIIVAHDNPGHVSILWGDGTAKYLTRKIINLNSSSNSVAVADLNKDSNPDIIVAGKKYNNISFLAGNGMGDFLDPVYFNAGTTPSSMIVSDLNKDGNLDVAVANQNSDSVSVFTGDGTGKFSDLKRFATGKGPCKIIAMDFNRDGLLDLATANQGAPDISVLLNTTISLLHRKYSQPQNGVMLYQNYPNPFNPAAKIHFYLPQAEYVLLELFNPLGQKILTLVDKNLPAGEHKVTIDASDFPNGIYFYRMQAGKFCEVKKMVLVR